MFTITCTSDISVALCTVYSYRWIN